MAAEFLIEITGHCVVSAVNEYEAIRVATDNFWRRMAEGKNDLGEWRVVAEHDALGKIVKQYGLVSSDAGQPRKERPWKPPQPPPSRPAVDGELW